MGAGPRRRDARKRLSWPLYEWAARKKHGRAAVVVVVAPDAKVGRWASAPILTPKGGSFRPLVLSPGTLAPVFEVEEAGRSPLRAVLVARLEEGRDKAVREVVGQQLAIRFGALSPEVTQRLRGAPLEDVERWAHRVVTAEVLEDVFEEAPEAP